MESIDFLRPTVHKREPRQIKEVRLKLCPGSFAQSSFSNAVCQTASRYRSVLIPDARDVTKRSTERSG